MSKAFTRETDLEVDEFAAPRTSLPGTPNYVTVAGAERWRLEIKHLLDDTRPPLLSAKEDGDAEAARQLRRLDARIRELSDRLDSAEVVPVPALPPEEVQFGATVHVRDDLGEEAEYRIVGVDEVDFDRGWVSWASPIARTLIQAHPGDRVPLATPGGERTLEVLSVRYENA